jgi:hypothetical protein
MQQPEEERRADQGGDHANWDSDRARDAIGNEKEERTADCGEWKDRARVWTNGESNEMRNNQANKADQAGERNGGGGCE